MASSDEEKKNSMVATGPRSDSSDGESRDEIEEIGSASTQSGASRALSASQISDRHIDDPQRSVCEQLGFTTTAKHHGHVGGLLAGKIGSNKFVADYAVDGRSKCRYGKCVFAPQQKYIKQSELRIGKIPPALKTGHSSRTHWFHLPCIFRSFKRSCKGTKTITCIEDIENFESLRRHDQDNIRSWIGRGSSSSGMPLPPLGGRPAMTPMTVFYGPYPHSSDRGDIAARQGAMRKKARTDDYAHGDGHTEHEVQSILGLTMISRGSQPPSYLQSIPGSVMMPPATIPKVGHSRPVGPRLQLSNPLTTFGSENFLHASWRPPGTSCDVLHNDNWHRAVIHGYTQTYAMVQKIDTNEIIRVHIERERHRVSWNGGKSQSSEFAS